MSLSTKIHAALKEMEMHLHKFGWRGKENDCVNLFAHRFLAKRVRPIDRIGIEVAVPQLSGKGRKQAVRKDLVIWKRSGDTTWGSDWRAQAVPMLFWSGRQSVGQLPSQLSPPEIGHG